MASNKILFFITFPCTCFMYSQVSLSVWALDPSGSCSGSPRACHWAVPPGTTPFWYLVPSSHYSNYEYWASLGPWRNECCLWLNFELVQSPLSQLKDHLVSAWFGIHLLSMWKVYACSVHTTCIYIYFFFSFWERLNLKSILWKKIK